MKKKQTILVAVVLLLSFAFVACGSDDDSDTSDASAFPLLSTGSTSTVSPSDPSSSDNSGASSDTTAEDPSVSRVSDSGNTSSGGATPPKGSMTTIRHEGGEGITSGKKVVTKQEDLNGDGQKDNIEYIIEVAPDSSEINMTLKVNDATFSMNADDPYTQCQIIDIDKRDGFKEIDIFDAGPSDDPVCTILAYDGKEIITVSEIGAYEYSLDGQGKIFTPMDTINVFSPSIQIGWEELQTDRTTHYVAANTDSFINKTYAIAYNLSSDGEAWPIFDSPDADLLVTPPAATVKKGDRVTLLEIKNPGTNQAAFKVKLNDGMTGWLKIFSPGD